MSLKVSDKQRYDYEEEVEDELSRKGDSSWLRTGTLICDVFLKKYMGCNSFHIGHFYVICIGLLGLTLFSSGMHMGTLADGTRHYTQDLWMWLLFFSFLIMGIYRKIQTHRFLRIGNRIIHQWRKGTSYGFWSELPYFSVTTYESLAVAGIGFLIGLTSELTLAEWVLYICACCKMIFSQTDRSLRIQKEAEEIDTELDLKCESIRKVDPDKPREYRDLKLPTDLGSVDNRNPKPGRKKSGISTKEAIKTAFDATKIKTLKKI